MEGTSLKKRFMSITFEKPQLQACSSSKPGIRIWYTFFQKNLSEFASNNGFQLLVDVLCTSERLLRLNCHLKLKLCARAHRFFNIFKFF